MHRSLDPNMDLLVLLQYLLASLIWLLFMELNGLGPQIYYMSLEVHQYQCQYIFFIADLYYFKSELRS